MSEQKPNFAGSKYEGMTGSERTMAQIETIQKHLADVAVPDRDTESLFYSDNEKGLRVSFNKAVFKYKGEPTGVVDRSTAVREFDPEDAVGVMPGLVPNKRVVTMLATGESHNLHASERIANNEGGYDEVSMSAPLGSQEARDKAAQVLRMTKQKLEASVDGKSV